MSATPQRIEEIVIREPVNAGNKKPDLKLIITPQQPIKTIEELILERSVVGELFELLSSNIYKPEKNLIDVGFESTKKYAPKKDGFYGIDYNPCSKILSGYIVDKQYPSLGLKFEARIQNAHFGWSMEHYLSLVRKNSKGKFN